MITLFWDPVQHLILNLKKLNTLLFKKINSSVLICRQMSFRHQQCSRILWYQILSYGKSYGFTKWNITYYMEACHNINMADEAAQSYVSIWLATGELRLHQDVPSIMCIKWLSKLFLSISGRSSKLLYFFKSCKIGFSYNKCVYYSCFFSWLVSN